MPWCPVCREEYIKGIKKCPECGSEFVDILPKEPISEEPINKFTPLTDYEEMLLFTSGNEVDYSLITKALEDEGVPFRCDENRMSDYYSILSGHSFLGKKVYVTKKDYHKAKEIFEYFMDLKKAIKSEAEQEQN